MEKLKMHSPDNVAWNIEKLMAAFPHCVVEARDKDGKICRKLDWDLLRQDLSGELVEGNQERYTLSWPGKREAMLLANSPVAKTLRPCREESVDFDKTKNLYIEGDNLDVLKLLQENYLGKIKMIYIDPPYNTGNDFVYEDDFAEDSETYLLKSNQKDEQGNRLIANTESNGRFHSDWLSMMYPRLKLARSLLTDDGVIFISIDDNEVHNLRKICDEIFGEQNFVESFIWRSRLGKGSTSTETATVHEYVICFAKNINEINFLSDVRVKENDSKERLRQWGQGDKREDRPTMYFSIHHEKYGEIYPVKPDGTDGRWRASKEKVDEMLKNGLLIFEKQDDGRVEVYRKIVAGSITRTAQDSILNSDVVKTTAHGSRESLTIFDIKIFDYSKPTTLLKYFLKLINEEDSIILDFFSGSATTAHAVMQLNAEDGGNRRFIMVQLPEACDEKSEAYKAGYKNICEIGKERIRRAGKKILEEMNAKTQKRKGEEEKKEKDLFKSDEKSNASALKDSLDIGFRVLKLDSSNMQDVYYTPDAVKQAQMELFTSNIKGDRSPEDLLFQVMLDWGIDLSLPITVETIKGKKVFFVDGNALSACFDDNVTEPVVKEIAKRKPMRAVFRDTSFDKDSTKINVEEIFKLLSSSTEVRGI